MKQLNAVRTRFWGSFFSRRRAVKFSTLALVVSLLALVSLGYLSGAAAMFYGLPSSTFLAKAFVGFQDWTPSRPARGPLSSSSADNAAVTEDQPGEACNGFTLVTKGDGPEADLLDMRGEVVHRWKMAAHRSWPRSPRVREPL